MGCRRGPLNSAYRCPSRPAPRRDGAGQFDNDWPGLFVRGDTAHTLMMRIRQLAERLAGHPDFDVTDAMGQLMRYADMIAEDVVVR